MRVSVRQLLILGLAPLLAACGDDGSGPDPVTIEEVAGRYQICTLTFVPEGSQPSVDLRTRAFELQGAPAPELRIDSTRETQLAFTPRGQNVSQDIRGTVQVNGTRVVIDFNQNGTRDASSILLPDPLRLNFDGSAGGARQLAINPTVVYNVPRADYARMAGVSEVGLAEQIPGTLQADFRTQSCG